MDDGGRRCALPGCAVEIQSASGRPERRFCSAAHRVAARQARRAAAHAQRAASARADLAGTLPWLGEPAAPVPRDPDVLATGPVLRPAVGSGLVASELVGPELVGPGAVARAAARRSRDSRPDDAAPRGRRALVVIGVAGILAGGYAVAAHPGSPDQAVRAQATPDGESADTWARRATVALAAVNTQLDTLSRAEEQWTQLPASRTGAVPAPVAALQERRSVLERRRDTLQSQLDTYRSLRETQQDLADSEQHLSAVETAPADTSPHDRGSAEQEAGAAALDEQRDLRIRRRDAQRAALKSLEDGVSAAARTPLPDDAADTAKVSDDVLEVVRNGGRAPQRSVDPSPPEPEDGTPSPSSTPPSEPSPPPSPESSPEPAQEPAPSASDADVLAELHEQARRVAREARRAEAERQAAQKSAQKSTQKSAPKSAPTAEQRPPAPARSPRTGPGRHRVAENLQVTRVAIRVGPGRHATLAVDLDDDAIEERNAERAARSG